jgi:hypothetical protein
MATRSALCRPSREAVITDEAIDQAILTYLSDAGGRWRKVAVVVSRAAVAAKWPEEDQGYERVASRIEALVEDGRLMAQGDIKNWRFSEVRIPS